MDEQHRRLRQPDALAIRPRLHPGEWLQSAISRWAWDIFGVSRGTLLDAFGLESLSEHEIRQIGHSPADDVLLNIGDALSIAPHTLAAMTMEAFNEHGPEIAGPGTPSITSTYLWARRSGTRFCPECLREHAGVFRKTWRLTWVFACLRHERLLLDACPQCLLPIPEPTGRSRFLWNPNHCRANIGGGLPVTPCGADLTDEVEEPRLPPKSLPLLTQAHILQVIANGDDGEATFHTLRGIAGALRAAQAHELIAELSGLNADELRGLLEPEKHAGTTPPFGAYAAAALITAAWVLHKAEGPSAHRIIRGVSFGRPPGPVPRGVGYGPGSPQEILTKWGSPRGAMRNKILAAHDPDLSTTQRIIYGTAIASIPANTDPQTKLRRRAPELPPLEPGALPILLWPEWASPFDVGAAVTGEALRRALSAAVSAVGQAGPERPRWADMKKTSSGQSQELERSLGRLLRPQMLGDESTATTLIHCLTELAIILRRVPRKINYAGRLRLPWQDILSREHWLMICDVAGHHPGSTSRLRNAQRYAFQRVTLAPTRLLPEHLAIGRHRQDAAEYSAFRRGVTEGLQNALDAYVENVLRNFGIDEPVTWAPSRREATLAAPGRELGDIDWPLLHALRQRGSTDSRLARELHRSSRHVRWAGDLRPHRATANAVKHDWVSITDSDAEPNPP